jgi:surface antigen
MCFGTEHVALVEKVTGDSVTTIEGNTSAGQVARRPRLSSTGDFVRPDYPN